MLATMCLSSIKIDRAVTRRATGKVIAALAKGNGSRFDKSLKIYKNRILSKSGFFKLHTYCQL